MAEPTSAQATSPPPSRPASPNVPPRDERNDEVAGDESAPLLQSEEGTRTVRFVSAKFVHFLTSLAMSSAVLALALIIVTKIVGSVVPGGTDIPWDTSDAMSAAVVTALFSIFICAVNLARIRRRRPLAPLAFNMLFDILIAAFAISYGAAGLSGVADYYGWNWGNLAVRVLSGIGLGMALIFGIVHLILFAARCRMAFLMESWRSPWSFPNGQVSFEVSIKFFREPQKPREGGDDAV